jgi:hypothetical protein
VFYHIVRNWSNALHYTSIVESISRTLDRGLRIKYELPSIPSGVTSMIYTPPPPPPTPPPWTVACMPRGMQTYNRIWPQSSSSSAWPFFRGRRGDPSAMLLANFLVVQQQNFAWNEKLSICMKCPGRWDGRHNWISNARFGGITVTIEQWVLIGYCLFTLSWFGQFGQMMGTGHYYFDEMRSSFKTWFKIRRLRNSIFTKQTV